MAFDDTDRLAYCWVAPAFVSDELLERIARLTEVESLDLTGVKISDRQLALLAPLVNLQTLQLCDCNITDASLDRLAGFKNLVTLDLTNTRVTDAGLAKLRALPNLSWLNLRLTDMTDEGLLALAKLPRLTTVDVSLTAVNEEAVARFNRDCPSVRFEFGASDATLAESLVTRNVARTPVSNDAEAIVAQPRPVVRLRAHGTHSSGGATVTVTDAGLMPLIDHPELEDLDLHDTAITDRGLNVIAKLTALKKLDVRGTRVTDDGVARLAESLPSCEIVR